MRKQKKERLREQVRLEKTESMMELFIMHLEKLDEPPIHDPAEAEYPRLLESFVLPLVIGDDPYMIELLFDYGVKYWNLSIICGEIPEVYEATIGELTANEGLLFDAFFDRKEKYFNEFKQLIMDYGFEPDDEGNVLLTVRTSGKPFSGHVFEEEEE